MALIVIAGTAVLAICTFQTPNNSGALQLTDPTTVELKFALGAGATTTWTYGGSGGIVRVSTGIYAATLTTTSYLGDGTVEGEYIGTGACEVVQPFSFGVQAPPL